MSRYFFVIVVLSDGHSIAKRQVSFQLIYCRSQIYDVIDFRENGDFHIVIAGQLPYFTQTSFCYPIKKAKNGSSLC